MISNVDQFVTNHPAIVLNNKAKINPNPELYEPYIRYKVPIKNKNKLTLDNAISGYKFEYSYEEYWSLRWPIHQGFERRDMGHCFAAVPSNKTEYGDIIADEVIIQVIKSGIQHEDAAVAEKWKNTWNFFKFIK
jgi:hypothetical protein